MFLEVYVFNSPSVTIEQVFEEESLPDFPSREVLLKQIEAEVCSIKWLSEERGQIDNTDYKGQLILGNPMDYLYRLIHKYYYGPLRTSNLPAGSQASNLTLFTAELFTTLVIYNPSLNR